MGVFRWFMINKSGQSYPVYDIEKGRVGTIYNREAFNYVGGEGDWNYIAFLGPNGSIVDATVSWGQHPFPNDFFTPCTDYPYGSDIIDGTTYKTFKMRQRKNIYTGAGNYWGAVAANMLVATNDYDSGMNHIDWKKINYVKRSTDGKWIKVEGDGYLHGFVDTGLSHASTYNTIPFYGSW